MAVLEIIFLLLPTVIILVTSFGSSSIITFPPEEFSLKWYQALLDSDNYLSAFTRSLFVATFSTAVSIPVGVMAAIGLHRYDLPFKNVLQLYLLIPFMIPLVVSGVILLIIFGQLGWLDHLWSVGLALAIVNIPFMIWSVSSSVNALDNRLEDAAKSLGAEELQTFIYVTIPALMPGIIMGSLLTFMLGLNEFIVSLIITSTGTITLPVEIYTSIRGSISPVISAISSVYIFIAILAMVVTDKLVGLEQFLRS
ncbi:ABC transporter permease [Halopenitus persicus]|uniref:ABC transporter permease n=1 Tax=Halopenitus persicus TaxID=1048396 RepID=UPI00210B54AD|nr:ABC transporter permease [Halopenitus persicus]